MNTTIEFENSTVKNIVALAQEGTFSEETLKRMAKSDVQLSDRYITHTAKEWTVGPLTNFQGFVFVPATTTRDGQTFSAYIAAKFNEGQISVARLVTSVPRAAKKANVLQVGEYNIWKLKEGLTDEQKSTPTWECLVQDAQRIEQLAEKTPRGVFADIPSVLSSLKLGDNLKIEYIGKYWSKGRKSGTNEEITFLTSNFVVTRA